MSRVLRAAPFALALALLCPSVFAGMIDLTLGNLNGRSGATIFAALSSNSGTGQYRSFLEIGDSSKDKDKIEIAYNSDFGQTVDNPECGTSAQFNHTIQWPNLPAIENPFGYQGWYIEFIGDANEVASTPGKYISLDKFEVWLSPYADLGGSTAKYYANWGGLTNTRMIGGLASTDWCAMDYTLSNGSGSGDIAAYVPWVAFRQYIWQTGVTAPYVYIYTQYGGQTGTYTIKGSATPVSDWTSSAGMEEWAHRVEPFVRKDVPEQVPEPGSAALMGFGLLALGALRRRKAKATA